MRKKLKLLWFMIISLLLFTGNEVIGQINLAVDHEAAANPYSSSTGTASLAFDGDGGSRWESAASDPQWIQIELDGTYTLNKLVITWETASAKKYAIAVSADGVNYDTISRQNDMANGARTDEIILNKDAKFVKLTGYARTTPWGYSIYEFKIYGYPQGATHNLTSLNMSAPKTRIASGELLTVAATGVDQDGYYYAASPGWSSSGGTITAGGVFSANTKSDYTVTATDGSVSGNINITVGDPKITGVTATASNGNAAGAVDGDMGSLWVGDGHSEQWITVDMGAMYYISQISIYWEGACAIDYDIDISADGNNWQNYHTLLNGTADGRTDEYNDPLTSRYVRINCLTPRVADWGYKIYEIELFGSTTLPTLSSLAVSANSASVAVNQELQLSLVGTDANGDAYATNPSWSTNANYSVSSAGVFTATVQGSYTITATDQTTTSVSNHIGITVTEPQVLTSITVSPSSATVSMGDDQQFTATGYDQNNQPMTITPTWSTTGGGTIDGTGLFSSSALGTFTITAQQDGVPGTASLTVEPVNLAVGKTVTVSSGAATASNAVDGDVNSRWESEFSDPQYIYVDLGATYLLSKFSLNWESANAQDYTLAISDDAANWQTIHTATGMAEGMHRIDNITADASARYVRMRGKKRNLNYGYSLFEFEILGIDLPAGKVLSTMDVVAASSTINITESVQLEARGYDADGIAFATTPIWSINDDVNASISADGIFTSNVEGTYRVTATNGSVSDYVDIVVKGPELTSIGVTPATIDVEAGKTTQFTATGYDQFNNEFAATFTYSVNGGGTVNSSGLFSATTVGNYTLTVNNGLVSTTADINVIPGNIALGKTMTADSEVQSAVNAGDSDAGTAWEGAAADSQYIYVDLTDTYLLSKVKLNWGAVSARAYTLAISGDAISWQTLYSDDVNAGGAHVSEITFNGSARYVRLLAKTRNGASGVILNEFEVYGQDLPAGKVLSYLTLEAPKTTLQVGKNLQIEAKGYDQDGLPLATSPVWSLDIAGATISTSGLFNATEIDDFVVTATDGSFSNTITIHTETNARLNQVVVSPATATVNIGQTKQFAAQGYDQFEEAYAATYDWSADGGGTIDINGVYTATTLGTFFVTATSNSVSPTTDNRFGTAELTVIQENLALGKTVTVSTEVNPGSNVVDNDPATFWTSDTNDDQFISVNLGAMYYLSKVNLNWQLSANAYSIDISADNKNWTKLVDRDAQTGEQRLDEIDFVSTAQYVRVATSAKNSGTGYRMNEFQILGEAVPSGKALSNITLSASSASIYAGESLQINIVGTDGDNEPFAVTPVWSSTGSGNVNETGVFTATSVGSYTVSATQGSVTGTIDITVLAMPALESMAVTPNTAQLYVNDTVNFAASGIDQYGNDFTVNPLWSVDGGGNINQSGRFIVTTPGSYTITISQDGKSATAVLTIVPENLVLNKPCEASSEIQAAGRAFDGSETTRWESAMSDQHWLLADMGAVHQISDILIKWETASAKDYTIDLSADKSNWQTIFTAKDKGVGARNDVIDTTASGRYIRMKATQRTSAYGYSIFEMVVHGVDLPAGVALDSIAILAGNTTANANDNDTLKAYGFDAEGYPFAIIPVWTVSGTGATISSDGVFNATTEGTFTVTATQGSVSCSLKINVRAASVLTSISVDPQDQEIRIGDSIIYTATAYNQYDEAIPTDIIWSTTGGGIIDTTGNFKADSKGTFTISATSGSVSGTSVVTILKGNLAKNKPVFASSQALPALNMVDGELITRWESEASDPQWIFVDLLENKYISKSIIDWEAASAKDYTIAISADSVYWQTIHNEVDNTTGARIDTLEKVVTARFVRITGTQRNTPYGYSIFETELIGESVPESVQLDSLSITAERDTIPAGYKLQLKIAGFDGSKNPYAVTPVWSTDKSDGTFTSTGQFLSDVNGDYVITATAGTVTATYKVVVAEPSQLESLTIDPASAQVHAAQNVQFNVTGIDQYGLEMETNVTWTTTGGGNIDENGLFTATTEGDYIITATQDSVSASAQIKVLPENLAYGKTATASSEVQPASNTTDGDVTTRWESAVGDTAWITVDLIDTAALTRIVLNWETASAKVFSIDVSVDNINWKQIYMSDTLTIALRVDTINVKATGRYIRINGIERNTDFGYSLYEIEAYGSKAGQYILSSIEVTPADTLITLGNSVQFKARAFNQDHNAVDADVVWSVDGGGTIDENGLFTTYTLGTFMVTALSSQVSSTTDTITGSTTIQVVRANLALKRNATASSEVNNASLVNDGDAATYWESEADADQWVYIDFAQAYTFDNFILNWNNNSATEYTIAISADGINWQTVLDRNALADGSRMDTLEQIASAKYVKVKGSDKTATGGYQLNEFEAYGNEITRTLNKLTVVSAVTQVATNSSIQLEADGFDADGNPFAAVPVWSVDNNGFISADGKFVGSKAGTYTITATSNGISATLTITVKGTGIKSNATDILKIYSANKFIYISNLNIDEFENISIFNIKGELVKQVTPESSYTEISVAKLQPGVYIVSLRGRSLVNKLVVVK